MVDRASAEEPNGAEPKPAANGWQYLSKIWLNKPHNQVDESPSLTILALRGARGNGVLHSQILRATLVALVVLLQVLPAGGQWENSPAQALYTAVHEGNATSVYQLISWGVSLKARNPINQRTVLHRVALSARTMGHVNVARILIDSGADVNARDRRGMTPLHYAATYSRHSSSPQARAQIAIDLIRGGANVNARTRGITPLCRAINERLPYMVRTLVSGGADVNARCDTGTPLALARRRSLREVAQSLIGAGAIDDTIRNPRIPLDLAVEGCSMSIQQYSAMRQHNQLFRTSGNPGLDAAFNSEIALLRNLFRVSPQFFLYDDSNGPNALATPSGVVMFGLRMMQREFMNSASGAAYGIPAIMAHEYAHIIQFQTGTVSRPVMNMELHADFMSGWYLARRSTISWTNVRDALLSLYRLGDYEFNNPNHHGTPQARLDAAYTGTQSAEYTVREAFEIGRRYVYE